MYDLKQSTNSQEMKIGPFLDDTDAKTAKAGLMIANTDIKVFKAGAPADVNKNSGGGTHIGNGYYLIVMDATDTVTPGSGMLTVNVSGALPVKAYFRVLAGNVYDALYGADRLEVDVKEMNSSAAAALRMGLAAGTMVTGTVTDTAFSPTSTACECSDITEATADHFIGRRILFTSGALLGQATSITDYALVSGRGRLTYEATASGEAPANGSTLIIV